MASASTRTDRYERFGWDYEVHSPLREAEVEWYAHHARAAQEPILELACGTGRLLLALAERGHQVVGLDRCHGMLRLVQQRLAQAADAVRKRVSLVQGDMTAFELKARLGLAILADNSLRELYSTADQEACMRCVYRHLLPGARLLLAVRRFDPDRSDREIPWSKWLRDSHSGDLVQRRISSRVTPDGTRMEGAMYYRTRRVDGTESMDECPFSAPVMTTADYVSLLTATGIVARVYSGYTIIEDDGADPVLCIVAERTPCCGQRWPPPGQSMSSARALPTGSGRLIAPRTAESP